MPTGFQVPDFLAQIKATQYPTVESLSALTSKPASSVIPALVGAATTALVGGSLGAVTGLAAGWGARALTERNLAPLAGGSLMTTPQQGPTGILGAIGRGIGAVMPGYQPWLGERPTVSPGVGQVPLLGQITRALGAVTPGYQPWLGERAPGYMGLTPAAAQQQQLAQYQPLLPGPGAQGGIPGIPGLIGSWDTGTAVFYKFVTPQGLRIGTFKRNGVFKSWRPYKPVCLGKRPTAAQAAKVVRGLKVFANRYEKVVEAIGWSVSHSKTRRTK